MGALYSAFPAGWGFHSRTRTSPRGTAASCRVGSDRRLETRRRPQEAPGPARSRNALIFCEEFNQLPVLSLCWYIRPRAAAKDNFPLLF